MAVKKILINSTSKLYVKDTSKEYHCKDGTFSAADLQKKNTSICTKQGTAFFILDAAFLDVYEKMQRGPQIITLKDIGLIITNTGINKDSIVVDAGAGSGALCCFLAHVAKKVTSYELREDFLKIVEQNKEALALSNLIVKNKDIYEGIDEKNVDVVTLDLPEPWKAIAPASKALKPGGYLVSYSPTIPQTSDFVEQCAQHPFIHLKTCELIEREWEFDRRKIRPHSSIINHTGFLTFMRKVGL